LWRRKAWSGKSWFQLRSSGATRWVLAGVDDTL
jgi:hypothetical protein